jgi:hypothetical protein
MTEEATTPQPAEAPKWAPEVENEARALGWKAPDEWKGEVPGSYIDNPERYLERAENFAPFRKVKEKLKDVETQAEERLRKIETVLSQTFERKQAELVRQIEQIKAEKVKAVEVGDVESFKALEKREDALRKDAEAPQEAPQQQPQANKDEVNAIEKWRTDKPWFGVQSKEFNSVMTKAAADLYAQATQRGMSIPERLAFVDGQMRDAFPHKFGALPVPGGAAVEGGLTFGGGSTASAYDKLPADAKKDFLRFVAKGVFNDTKEDRATYAEDYNAA